MFIDERFLATFYARFPPFPGVNCTYQSAGGRDNGRQASGVRPVSGRHAWALHYGVVS